MPTRRSYRVVATRFSPSNKSDDISLPARVVAERVRALPAAFATSAGSAPMLQVSAGVRLVQRPAAQPEDLVDGAPDERLREVRLIT